jgi:hypothetical protein
MRRNWSAACLKSRTLNARANSGGASQRQAADLAVAADGYDELIKKTTEFVSKQVAAARFSSGS